MRYSPSAQIQKVLDFNDQNLMLIEYQPNYKILTLYQCSIIGPQKVKIGSTSKILNDPTPLQYCVIKNLKESLIGLLAFMRKNKDIKYAQMEPQDYIKALYFPQVSNTPQSLIRLAAELGQFDCLKILLSEIPSFFPNNANESIKSQIREFIVALISDPDYEKVTPFAAAVEAGQNEIATYLLDQGADIFKTNNDEEYQAIYIHIAIRAPDNLTNFKEMLAKLNVNLKEESQKYYYNEHGHARPTNGSPTPPENFYTFTDYLINIFARKHKDGARVVQTLMPELVQADKVSMNENEQATPKASPSSATEVPESNQPVEDSCCFPGCQSSDTQSCGKCGKYYCEEHMQEHNC